MYDERSTEDLFRVARLVTPVEDLHDWVATAWGRSWYRDGSGDWRSVTTEPDMGGHRYDDGTMREFLTEQLERYGVLPVNAIWQMH